MFRIVAAGVAYFGSLRPGSLNSALCGRRRLIRTLAPAHLDELRVDAFRKKPNVSRARRSAARIVTVGIRRSRGNPSGVPRACCAPLRARSSESPGRQLIRSDNEKSNMKYLQSRIVESSTHLGVSPVLHRRQWGSGCAPPRRLPIRLRCAPPSQAETSWNRPGARSSSRPRPSMRARRAAVSQPRRCEKLVAGALCLTLAVAMDVQNLAKQARGIMA